MFRWIKYVMFLCLCHCTKERLSQNEYHMDTDDKKALYAMGFEMSKRIQSFDLTDSEVEMLVYGLTDSLRSKPKKDGVNWTPFITSFIDKKSKSIAEKNKELGREYVAKMLSKGFTQTKSGLLYKIIRPGHEDKARLVDSVLIDYEGKHIDGSVFESSYKENKKLTVAVSSVIKGWREALQLIGARGEIELITPSNLAYGDAGSYPNIPQGATLHFKISLYNVNRLSVSASKK